MRTFLATVLLFFVAIGSLEAAPRLKADHPDSYVVVKGDTLWGISARFLEDPWMWPEIWQVNPQIDNPHLIYPGDMLALVYIEGQPRLMLTRRGEEAGTLKLSPKKRITPLASAIPAIPLESIAPFMSDSRVVEPDVLEKAPYVLLGKKGNIIVGAGDQLFARGQSTEGMNYGLYRRSQLYVDPVTQEVLGLEARSVAHGAVSEVDGDILTVEVARSSEEVRMGDRLLEQEDREINSTFYPEAPEQEIDGQVIAVMNGVSQIGQYDVVVVNRGVREGLEQGHVLAVYQRGKVVRDPYTREKIQLPPSRAGLMMIFRVFEKVSYGLILASEQPLAVLDEIRKP